MSKENDKFLTFNYPELKDLGKHFLTISSATLVFFVTFIDKVAKNSLEQSSIKLILVFLLLSIVTAGLGIFVNYVAGSGASGAIVWGIGKDYKRLTAITYVLYLLAGLGLILAYFLMVFLLI